MYRCINLDWLEVYCLESPYMPITAEYFQKQGWNVKRRAYGTRQYQEMFTLCWGDFGIYEVRRNPLSKKSQGGIFPDEACHIRLCNRQNYCPQPIESLIQFLRSNRITFKSISRFDLAMDFYEFDYNHKTPEEFVAQYMRGEIAKIHQSKLSVFGEEKQKTTNTLYWDVMAHGEDNWNQRTWNSLKWGSPTSLITTKLYNKTMELNRPGHDKPYIRDAWKACGFPEDRDVWRIEFAIRSGKRHQIEMSSGKYKEVKLEQLITPELIQMQFFIYFAEYFHFKLRERTRNGTMKRKDLCKDVVFFSKVDKPVYQPITVTKQHDTNRTDRMLIKRLRQIAGESPDDRTDLKTACAQVIEYIWYKQRNTGIMPEEIAQMWTWIDDLIAQKPLVLTYDK